MDHVGDMLESFRNGRGFACPVAPGCDHDADLGVLSLVPGNLIDNAPNPRSMIVAWSKGAAVVLDGTSRVNRFVFIQGGFPGVVAEFAANTIKEMMKRVAKDREPRGHALLESQNHGEKSNTNEAV